MNKLYSIFCLCMVCAFGTLHAQTPNTPAAKPAPAPTKGYLKGKLVDTSTHQILKQATITVVSVKDSSTVGSVVTDDKGAFVIYNIPPGNYKLTVEYAGYETRRKSFSLTRDSMRLDAGTIYMQLKANTLAGVTVESPPIQIKADTTEYNAQMFKTKPNGTVEDLLQKLPGVDVDTKGNIKAQGEQVQRILVDGKRFFADDPLLASKNLPADVIDKVQVFDDLSDQSKFTGFDDGNRVKTINIITKKNMRKGYFGKIIAGAANKGLYDEAASISKFNGNQQLTFIGQANNTNHQNFTVQDILGTGGGGGGRGGGAGGAGNIGGSAGGGFGGAGGNRAGNGLASLANANGNNGLTTTLAGGLNYRDSWGKNTDAYGSYFYNNLLLNQQQKSTTENFLKGDSDLFNNQNQNSTTRNINQRMSFNIETTFDTLNSMIIRPNFSYQQAYGSSTSSTITSRLADADDVSSSTANTNSHTAGYNGTVDVLLRHKFKKRGRTMSLDLTWTGNSNDGTGTNESNNTFYLKNRDSLYNINQYYTTHIVGQGISATLDYTEPLSKHSILQFDFNYTYNKNIANRYTYNYDSTAKQFNQLDTLLTNTYQNTYESYRGTAAYRFQNSNLNFSLGSGVQFGNSLSINTTKDISIPQQYANIYPTANLTYRFSQSTTLRFNYTGRTSQPTAQQLEPIVNNSDPMNITIGNPNLQQSFSNTFRLLFMSFNRTNFHNMFASINASFVQNNIVNGTVTNLSTGVDSIKPINLNGTYNVSAFFNYGFPLKKPKSNLNFTTNFVDTRGVSGLAQIDSASDPNFNLQRQFTTNYTLGETVKWTTNLKKGFDMNFSAAPTYNIAKYSVLKNSDSSITYFSMLLVTEATWYTESGWLATASLNDTYYGGREAGYNTSVPLLNVGFAKQFLKGKKGELRLTVYDLLNQNVSISRTVTSNYVQDTQTKLLTRYVLLTFTYNLRNFNANDANQQRRRGGFGGPGGPGGFGPPPQ